MTEPVRQVQNAELPRHLAMALQVLQHEPTFSAMVEELSTTKQNAAYHLAGLRLRGLIRSEPWWPHKRKTADGWSVILWEEPSPYPDAPADIWRVTAHWFPRRDGKRERVPYEAVVVIEPGTANWPDLDDEPPGVMLVSVPEDSEEPRAGAMLVPSRVRLAWDLHLDRMDEAGLSWVNNEELRVKMLVAIGVVVGTEVVLPAWRAEAKESSDGGSGD